VEEGSQGGVLSVNVFDSLGEEKPGGEGGDCTGNEIPFAFVF
jgi:hypothetical protein